MTATAPADPFALPAAAARAVAPRTARATGTPPEAERPITAPRVPEASAPVVADTATGAPLAAPGGARELLRRLVSHAEALATLGITEQQYAAWGADGRAWPTWTRPDGERLADAADVLAVLELAGGAA